MYFIFKLVVIYYAIWKIRQYEFYLDLFTPANRLYWYTTSLYFPNKVELSKFLAIFFSDTIYMLKEIHIRK